MAGAGLTLLGSGPVEAQLPELFPSSTTTSTRPPSTSTTLLPELIEDPLKAPGDPARPTPSTTAAPLLPAPAPTPAPGARTTGTTTFTTTPIPPRTPVREIASPAAKQASAPRTNTTAVDVGELDASDSAAGFSEALPYQPTPGDEATTAAGAEGDMELGADAGLGLDSMASVAAGLIAVVLLGVVVWVQRQARGAPRHAIRSAGGARGQRG